MGFQQYFIPNGVDGETVVKVQLPELWKDEGRTRMRVGRDAGGVVPRC